VVVVVVGSLVLHPEMNTMLEYISQRGDAAKDMPA
jgi:hypothetical protein